MALYQDFITITIDAVDVSDYVLSYQRNESLCEPGQVFALLMTRKKPDDSMLDIGMSDDIVITEKYPSGDVVLKGYVTNVEIDASNAEMRVTGSDKYVLLHDYFIDDRLETAGESVQYWIEYICNLAELSVQFDSIPGIATDGADGNGGTPLGMQKASDAIRVLERKGAVYTRYDSDIDKIRVYRLTTSEPSVTIATNNLVVFDQHIGTELTRNVVKVWGGHHYDWLSGEEHQYLAVARVEMDELPVDKTIYMASPEVRSQTFAAIIANRMLALTANLDDLVQAECAGLYPGIEVSEFASLFINQGNISYAADRQITSVNMSVDTSGAKTTFTFGEKCPRVAFSPPPYYVYATYQEQGGGVAISYDAGLTFNPFNTGLESVSGLVPTSIAANTYNQLVMTAVSGVYKRAGIYGSWTRITALDDTLPSNDEGQYQFDSTGITFIKAEKETGNLNKFHLLAEAKEQWPLPSGQSRCWSYWTPDFGGSWNSMQLYVPGSGIAIGTPSGLSMGLIDGSGMAQSHLTTITSGVAEWNVEPFDMEGDRAGNITVLLGGEPGFYTPEDKERVHSIYVAYPKKGQLPWPGEPAMRLGWWDLQEFPGEGEVINAGRVDDDWVERVTMANDNTIFSVPHDTRYAVAFARYEIGGLGGGTASYKIWRTTVGGVGGAWEECGFDPEGTNEFSVYEFLGPDPMVFHDWRSLEPGNEAMENIIRFVVVEADCTTPDTWTAGATNNQHEITAFFYEMDITKDAETSMECWMSKIELIGSDYLNAGWEGISPGSYTYPRKPRMFDVDAGYHSGALGGQAAAVTVHLHSNNTAYFMSILRDRGTDDGWDWQGEVIGWVYDGSKDDYEEFFNMGFFLWSLDFETHTLSLDTFDNIILTNPYICDNAKPAFDPDTRSSVPNSTYSVVNTIGGVPYSYLSLNDYVPEVALPENPHPEECYYPGRDSHTVYVLRHLAVVHSQPWEVPGPAFDEPITIPNGHVDIPFYDGDTFLHFTHGTVDANYAYVMVSPGLTISELEDTEGAPLVMDEYGIFRLNPNNSYYGIVANFDFPFYRYTVVKAQRAGGNEYEYLVSGFATKRLGRYIGMDARTNEYGQFYITASGTGYGSY